MDLPILDVVVTSIGGLSTLVGAAASSDAVQRVLSRFVSPAREEGSVSGMGEDQARAYPASSPNTKTAMLHLDRRVTEAKALERRYGIDARIYHWSARSLSFSQYIIGGVLTLSFVKQTFSTTTIGVFGVIVFVASGLSQRFNPEANAEVAEQKTEQLGALIRDTEDKRVAVETTTDFSDDDPRPILDLTKKLSTEITRLRALSKARKRAR